MTKKTFVPEHAHHWFIEGTGEVVKGKCTICGAEASFLNFIDWSLIEKKHKSAKDVTEDEIDLGVSDE